MITALVLCSALLVADPGEWTPSNTAAELTLAALAVADLALSARMAQEPDGIETNPLLGPAPSFGRMLGFGVGAVALHAAVAYLLPPPWRGYWQAGGLAVEGYVVAANVGLCVRYVW